MDVLSAQPRNAEKHRAVRFARDGMDAGGRATQEQLPDANRTTASGARPFWLLFGAMPKSNPLATGERKLCTSEKTSKSKNWIPAFAE